jgi:hypothetical protein
MQSSSSLELVFSKITRWEYKLGNPMIIEVLLGQIFLRCTKIMTQCQIFIFFYLVIFLPFKNTFIDDYDGIYNCSGLKYGTYEIFETF